MQPRICNNPLMQPRICNNPLIPLAISKKSSSDGHKPPSVSGADSLELPCDSPPSSSMRSASPAPRAAPAAPRPVPSGFKWGYGKSGSRNRASRLHARPVFAIITPRARNGHQERRNETRRAKIPRPRCELQTLSFTQHPAQQMIKTARFKHMLGR